MELLVGKTKFYTTRVRKCNKFAAVKTSRSVQHGLQRVFSCKMRSIWSFKKQGMWTRHFPSRVVHAPIHRMSYSASCMMCFFSAVSCRIDRFPQRFGCGCGHHVHRTWIPAIISFGATSKIVCTAPTRVLFRTCKRKLKLMVKGWQATSCVTFLTTLWFVYSESTKSKDLILKVCSHENHMHRNSPWKWAFIHIFLNPRKLQIYRTSKLLFFWISCILQSFF